MRTLTDEEKEKLMNEIIQNMKMKREKLHYERTIQEFADETGTSFTTARRTLYRLEKEGKMVRRKLTNEHGWTVVFSCVT